jgi:hypothetical protein
VVAAGPAGSTPESITYRFTHYRLLTFGVFIPLGLAGVAMLVNLLAGGTGPPAVFVGFWLFAYAWSAYWWLFRIAFEVGVVRGSTLRWRSITSSHEVPLARVQRVHTPIPPFGIGLKRIVVDGDRSPLIIANKGYQDVIAMIVRFRPDLEVPTGWYDRMYDVLGMSSARWRRVDVQ